jgi:phosphoglycolate phosphatase
MQQEAVSQRLTEALRNTHDSTMKFKAIMFDLDGTLLNTLEDLGDSMNAMLREQEYAEHPYDFYRLAVGDGARTLVERALPEKHRNAQLITDAHAALRVHYLQHWDKKTKPYDGILNLLDALVSRGATLTILSNKPDESLQKCATRFLPTNIFTDIRGVLPDGPIKPDPGGALDIISKSEIPRDAWLYVGDTNTDMQTAQAAGLFAIGCTWGFRERDELVSSGADAIVDHPEEILSIYDSRPH